MKSRDESDHTRRESLRTFLINSVWRQLYLTFFKKLYGEGVGTPCNEISASGERSGFLKG